MATSTSAGSESLGAPPVPPSSTLRAPHRVLRSVLNGLVYVAEPGRDLRFDFLRGFAVFAMVVDHLAGPSKLYLVTGGNRFYTSAAEGFVFISGLIVGLVYRRLIARDGLARALRRLIERAWQLYVLAVGLTLVMLPVSELLGLPWAQGVDLRNPAALVWSIITLHRTYYLVDVPLLYALLLIIAPLALVLMYEGRTWAVLLLSWLIWAGYQVFPELTEFPWPIAGNYLFQFPTWQVLFFTAMALGYHHDRVASAFPRWTYWSLLLLSGLGSLGLVFLFVNTGRVLQALAPVLASTPLGGRPPIADLMDILFAKGDVRPGRIVASAVVFTFLFLLTSQFWGLLRRAVGWLLVPLGQNALYAYSAHVAFALAIGVAATWPWLPVPRSPEANTVLQLAALAIIWLAIRFRVLLPDETTRRRWMAVPVPIALALLVVLRVTPVPAVPEPEPVTAGADSEAARAARRFGTPIPREKAEAIARNTGTPAPDVAGARATPGPTPPPAVAAPAPRATPAPPAPVQEPAPVARAPAPPAELRAPAPAVPGEPRVSEFVGAIRGALREFEFYSPALDQEMPYFIYLPPQYGTEQRRYPVLYMLHGIGGHRDEWVYYGLVDTVDQLITSKEIKPMIVVLPQGDESYWVNHVGDGPRWGDYVAENLVRHIDATFRTLPYPEHRAIGGLSNGASAALQLGLTHPDEFRVIGAHSPSLHEEGSLPIQGTGQEYSRRDPISLAASAPGIEPIAIWIDIGEDDPWLKRAELLHKLLGERGINHWWSVLAGGHEGEYWQRNVVTYVRFYDSVLNWRSGG